MDEDQDAFASNAFHEAGHAVVVWSVGVRLFEIVVDIAGGICTHQDLLTFTLDRKLMDPMEWRRAEKQAKILWGGEVAQSKFDSTRKPSDFDGESDRKKLLELAGMLFPDSENTAIRWITDMKARSEQIVYDRWDVVERLAWTLMDRPRMSGKIAISLLEAVG